MSSDATLDKADSETSSHNSSGSPIARINRDADDVDEEEPFRLRPGRLSRRPSSPNLASYQAQAQEEGRMHRIGQRIRRDILRPETEDHAHGTTGLEGPEPKRLAELRRRLEAYPGEEIRQAFERLGPDGMFKALLAEGGLDDIVRDHEARLEFEKWVNESGEGDESMRAIVQAAAGMTLKDESNPKNRDQGRTTDAAGAHISANGAAQKEGKV